MYLYFVSQCLLKKVLENKVNFFQDHFDLMLNSISIDSSFDEEEFAKLSKEKYEIEDKLSKLRNNELSDLQKAKIEDLYSLIDLMGNYPPEFDDVVVRKSINRVVALDKDQVEITFVDGLTVIQQLE